MNKVKSKLFIHFCRLVLLEGIYLENVKVMNAKINFSSKKKLTIMFLFKSSISDFSWRMS